LDLNNLGGSDMGGYSRREQSSSAIRKSGLKESQFAKGTGYSDMIDKVSRYDLEPTVLKPNDRHDGIALTPLPNAPKSTRNLSLPKPLDDGAELNVHPIHCAPTPINLTRGTKQLNAIAHSNFKVQGKSRDVPEDLPLGAA
jgi:hypothetical protein